MEFCSGEEDVGVRCDRSVRVLRELRTKDDLVLGGKLLSWKSGKSYGRRRRLLFIRREGSLFKNRRD
jgi:hypothetical protein